MLPDGICCRRKYVARRDLLPEEILEGLCYRMGYITGGDMLPDGICCQRRMLPEEICYWRVYVTGWDMLPEEICYWSVYVTGWDMLPEEIYYWRGYVTEGDMLPQGIPF